MPGAFSFVQLPPCLLERKGASHRTFQSVRGIALEVLKNGTGSLRSATGLDRGETIWESPPVSAAGTSTGNWWKGYRMRARKPIRIKDLCDRTWRGAEMHAETWKPSRCLRRLSEPPVALFCLLALLAALNCGCKSWDAPEQTPQTQSEHESVWSSHFRSATPSGQQMGLDPRAREVESNLGIR